MLESPESFFERGIPGFMVDDLSRLEFLGGGPRHWHFKQNSFPGDSHLQARVEKLCLNLSNTIVSDPEF